MTNWYKELSSIDVSEHVREKNGLKYLSWMWAWTELKTRYPLSYSTIHKTPDGSLVWREPKGGHVETSVTIVWFEDGVRMEHEERNPLPVMDLRNRAIDYENIDSVTVNKSIQRCITKCIAKLGLGAYLYMNEDLPESIARAEELKDLIKEVVKKRCSISDKASEKVAELCKKAEKEANPNLDEELISGNYKNIDDVDILENLYNNLLAVRK